jgi:hypothetical protein
MFHSLQHKAACYRQLAKPASEEFGQSAFHRGILPEAGWNKDQCGTCAVSTHRSENEKFDSEKLSPKKMPGKLSGHL